MDVVGTALITSVIGTGVTYGAAETVKWLRARHNAEQFPLTFARSATNGLWVLVNDSRTNLLQVSANCYGPGPPDFQELLPRPGITMPVGHTEYLFNTIEPGSTVFIRWKVRNRKKDIPNYAETIKIQTDKTRYTPRRRLAPPPEWGG